MNKNQCKPCGCSHTHTHTHGYFSKSWSKGGSREHRDVVILPRDCE